MFTIYMITCPIERACYVGQTYRGMLERYREHWETSKRSQYQDYPLYKAFREHGPDAFNIEELYKTPDGELANLYEIYYIYKYSKLRNMYNKLSGGAYKAAHEPRNVYALDLRSGAFIYRFFSYNDLVNKSGLKIGVVAEALIETLPIGRYWICFPDKTYRVRLKLHKKNDNFVERFWNINYSNEALRMKRKLLIDKEAYTYDGSTWYFPQW